MNYLSVDGLVKHYGELLILDRVGFGLERGQKVALVAKNGTGKSTLLRILAGKDTAEEGEVVYRQDIRVGFLDQTEDFPPERNVEEMLLSGNHPALEALRLYHSALESGDDALVQRAYEDMEKHAAWDFETQARQIAGNLQLTEHMKTPVGKLSGGQRKRLALARVLADHPDILLLDEPTNHLDLGMIEWLEQYLSRQNLTVLMVTHDRYFLDRVCSRILELEDAHIMAFDGNYSYYTGKKAELVEQAQSSVLKAKNLYRRELEWMRRQPKARGTKSKSRIDAFYDVKGEAHKRIGKDDVQLDVKTTRMGAKVVELHNVSKSLGGKKLIEGLHYHFQRKEKVGVVGPNGSGKSTLLNLITGKLTPDTGKVVRGETIQIGYYTQTGLNLREDRRVIEVVKDIAEVIPLSGGKKLTAGQLCERFLFDGKKQYQYVHTLSGGEKKRLFLLTILMQNPNFLILDEPTNDLDIPTLVILEDFLKEFDGCVLIVSHDRFFLDKVVDHVFAFEGEGRIKDFPGNYTQYRTWRNEQDKLEARERSPKKPDETVSRKKPASRNKISFKEKFEYEQLETAIAELEEKKDRLTMQLQDAGTDHEKMMRISGELQQVVEELEVKSDRWLALAEKMEDE